MIVLDTDVCLQVPDGVRSYGASPTATANV